MNAPARIDRHANDQTDDCGWSRTRAIRQTIPEKFGLATTPLGI
jgi:hypothetical protein